MIAKEDRALFVGLAVFAVAVVAIIVLAIGCTIHDSHRQDEFKQRCEESGGMVLAENRWDRVCVQGNFRQTDRMDR